MTKFKTEFYQDWSGILFGLDWGDERRYRLASTFLKDLTGGPALSNTDGPDFYYLEAKRQYGAVQDFRRKLDWQEGSGGP